MADRLEDYPAIIALRNVLVHAYDQVDNGRMWDLIQRHLPGCGGPSGNSWPLGAATPDILPALPAGLFPHRTPVPERAGSA